MEFRNSTCQKQFAHGKGPNRTWVAFDVEGLAPYWFETEATVYIGEDGRTAARVQFECEELLIQRLIQRLILQPKIEVNLYGKTDPERGTGSGLSNRCARVASLPANCNSSPASMFGSEGLLESESGRACTTTTTITTGPSARTDTRCDADGARAAVSMAVT